MQTKCAIKISPSVNEFLEDGAKARKIRNIEIKDLLKEDVAVLAMGIYLAMSQKDMLNYWNRIFVHNAQDSTAPGMPVAATHAAPSTISSSNGPAGFPGYTA